ncbi:hypothetical protein NDU88_006944 [Pleurodeles waltl]|uniref:Uncharacterized protein n=1 Tax=Pleurodeles waltl TaxID=8319 RepID=A0AAV7NVG9_PLEWA|nr:hypothetical protein NDU88_006944 [Pleurodeles waltl]
MPSCHINPSGRVTYTTEHAGPQLHVRGPTDPRTPPARGRKSNNGSRAAASPVPHSAAILAGRDGPAHEGAIRRSRAPNRYRNVLLPSGHPTLQMGGLLLPRAPQDYSSIGPG